VLTGTIGAPIAFEGVFAAAAGAAAIKTGVAYDALKDLETKKNANQMSTKEYAEKKKDLTEDLLENSALCATNLVTAAGVGVGLLLLPVAPAVAATGCLVAGAGALGSGAVKLARMTLDSARKDGGYLNTAGNWIGSFWSNKTGVKTTSGLAERTETDPLINPTQGPIAQPTAI